MNNNDMTQLADYLGQMICQATVEMIRHTVGEDAATKAANNMRAIPLPGDDTESAWKPVVGGTVETEEQYAALPEGSIVASSSTNPYVRGSRSDGDYWLGIGCDDKFSNLYMARISRTILRVGWSL